MREIAPRLHRWTAPHPGCAPDAEPGSTADWPEHVGSVLYQAPDAAVFIDPLVPGELWPELDERVAGRSVVVLTTLPFHGGETMYWLPGPRALVPGDRLLGDGAGGLRLCPESWLRYLGIDDVVDELRAALRPLLELPAEHVLVSHWDPVVGGGHAALRRRLGITATAH